MNYEKACFQHDMAYGDFKNVFRRTDLIKYYMIKHLILLKIKENYFESTISRRNTQINY